MRRSLLPVLTLAFAVTASPAAQDAPTFRTATRLVVQTVTVTDQAGHPIEGLTAADFLVTEDGIPQEIAFLEYQRLRGEAGAVPAPVAAPPPRLSDLPPLTQTDLPSTLHPDARFRDRRLLIFYFDPSSLGSDADRYRAFEGALRFTRDHMDPADLVAVMSYSGGAVRVRQDFTDDREQLEEVLLRLLHDDDLDGDGFPDTLDDIGTPFGQNDAEFNVFNTNRQLSALQTAVTTLRPLPEQKTLLYFGSGLRLNASENLAQLRATINAAVRANVTINPIDARGLVAMAPLGDATRRSPGGIGMFTGALATAAVTNLQRSQDTLYALARDTGGRALFDSNDLAAGIVQAAQAVTSYYILGYYSTNADRDGQFRRVRVTLADGRRAELSYREGYYADKEFARYTASERERQLEEALMLDDPITEITLALELNYFQLNTAEYFVPVAVKIPGGELALARRRGAVRTELDVIGEVKDEFGLTIQNMRDRLDIRLDEATAEQLGDRPIQYETGFSLLPGRYELKLLVRDATTGRIGTYQTPFVIPNLMREEQRVPISTVVLASQRVPLDAAVHEVRQRIDGHAASPLVHDGQKLMPSVTRVFSASRDLHLFFQAYQRPADPAAPLVAYVTFFRDGVKAFETSPLLQEDAPEGRANAVSIRVSLPLAGLPSGTYDCQVTVIDPAAQRAAFWQAPVLIVP
jgi:VWFA-related protein